MENQSTDEIEVDIIRAVKSVLRKWPLILIAVCLTGALSYKYFNESNEPSFSSSGKIYIIDKEEKGISVSIEDLDLGSRLVEDYKELIKSRIVLDKVISRLHLNLGFEELNSCITICNPKDTRIIGITLQYNNRAMIQKILNEIEDVTCGYLSTRLGTEHPMVLERASTPEPFYKLKVKLFTLLAAFGAGFLVCLAFALMDILNGKVRYQDDITDKLQLELIGNVPYTAKRKKAR